MSIIEVHIPDIGDAKDLLVAEILVQPGDNVASDQSLLVVESDKATIDIPAPTSGRLDALLVKVGDRVNKGDLVAKLTEAETIAVPRETPNSPLPLRGPGGQSQFEIQADIVIIGGGPGGYSAAFRAADLGAKVVLVERDARLGGVCLNVGCIPSKALLHVAKFIFEAENFSQFGLRINVPEIDLANLRAENEKIITKLTGGLSGLARQRRVEVIQGEARFIGPHALEVKKADDVRVVSFDRAIIATGSEPRRLPFLPQDERIIDSTGALALRRIPSKLLIIGGGAIGLEMASIYAALGSRVTIVESAEQLMPGADSDLVVPLQKRLSQRIEKILLSAKISAAEPEQDGIRIVLETAEGQIVTAFDEVLVAVGRSPNGKRLNAEAASVAVTEEGFIPVDSQMRTNVAHIFAIGDVTGQPMLAHKAIREGHVAAEVACGQKVAFDTKFIPVVAYTDPEIAWVGLTETQAIARHIPYRKAVFPWAASGRALAQHRDEGMTKILYDPETHKLLGAGIVGSHAGDLIAEAVLALEMGADAADIALTIHPHPTLSETFGAAGEVAEGTVTDLMRSK
jgi:dihydrolipoamide dehydrogenase